MSPERLKLRNGNMRLGRGQRRRHCHPPTQLNRWCKGLRRVEGAALPCREVLGKLRHGDGWAPMRR